MGSCVPSNIELHKVEAYKDTATRNLELEFEICQLEKMEDSLNEKIDSNISLAASYIERQLVHMARNKLKENILYKRQLGIISRNRLNIIRIKNNMLLKDMNGKLYDFISSGECKGNKDKRKSKNKKDFIEEYQVYGKVEEENKDIDDMFCENNEFNEKEIDIGLENVVNMLNERNRKLL